MKHLFKFALCGALLAAPVVAHACSCAPPPAPKVALEQAAAVFVGRVKSVERLGSPEEFNSSNTFQFAVSKKWKGVAGDSVSVESNGNSAACGINFDSDRDYLIYAFKTDGSDQLRTNLCTRTKRAADAAADFAELGEPIIEAAPDATTDETPDATMTDENGVVQLNATASTGAAAAPLALLNRTLQSNPAVREIRLNWSFDWKLQTFPPTLRQGIATALYNRDDSTLKLYAKYNDAVGSYVKHILYRGVTDENLQQLANKYQSDDGQENFAYLDRLPQVGAAATDLGSIARKRRVFNLK